MFETCKVSKLQLIFLLLSARSIKYAIKTPFWSMKNTNFLEKSWSDLTRKYLIRYIWIHSQWPREVVQNGKIKLSCQWLPQISSDHDHSFTWQCNFVRKQLSNYSGTSQLQEIVEKWKQQACTVEKSALEDPSAYISHTKRCCADDLA